MRYRLALITGASQGIGYALAHKLASEGIPLLLTARNQELLERLQKELPVHSEIIALDLSLSEDLSILLNLIHEKKPDLVVNNAGIGLYGSVLNHTLQETLQILELNIKALSAICIESARVLKMAHLKGTILNIASAAAFLEIPNLTAYSASKAYVKSFSLGLAEELKPHGIHILCSCPGKVDTNFSLHASKGIRKTSSKKIPVTKAASILWKQISTQKRLLLFTWPYKLGILLTWIIPKKLIYYFLK